MFFSSSTRMTRMLCIGISVAVTVTFRRNPTEFYSANIPNFSCVSVLLFQVCIHACRKPTGLPPSKEGVRTKGTGHCKYKICSLADLSLVKLGKPAAGQLWELCPVLRSVPLYVCNGMMGRNGPGGKIYLFAPQGAHTPRQKYSCITFPWDLLPCQEAFSLQPTAAAGRGAVKPAHQGRVFSSCRNLDRALAGRTPCPTPHTEQMLLLFGKKRSGEHKPNNPHGGSASHPLPWLGNRWKHQDLSRKLKCRCAGGKCFCQWSERRTASPVVISIFSA